jgi:penicillin-binding protein-related factor A (putative recombinase)
MEYKVVRGKKSLPFDVLTEAQEKGLLEFEKAGGKSFVLVCYRGRRKGNMRAFAVPIRRWIQLRETLGRNSLPYGFWSNGGVIELPRLSGGRWGIRRLLRGDRGGRKG